MTTQASTRTYMPFATIEARLEYVLVYTEYGKVGRKKPT